jgi:putative ABC transport system permease protein
MSSSPVPDLDSWQEILETLRRNKLRAGLTAFSVAWGIFMLVVLLGSGQGLANGVSYQFRDDATNSIWIWPGQTSVPFAGLSPGRNVQFTNADYDDVRSHSPDAERVTARFRIAGPVVVARGKESGAFDVRCVHPDHLYLEKTMVVEGRFLNERDISELRKVAVIGKLVKDALFAKEDPIGAEIQVNGISFRVVGVFEDAGNESEMEKVYLPITTAQRTFNGSNRIGMVMFTVGDASLEESKLIAKDVTRRLATRHRFDAADARAVRVNNNIEQFARFTGVIAGIRAFTWLVGVGTILAGIVGVSNIMLITVRERTREIGIRKAMGATPRSIIAQVLQESVLVTSVAGLAGLVLGVVVLDVASRFLGATDYFRNPQVDMGTAIEATIVLILAGTLAGLIPARRAAAIKPVEALREE